MSSIAYNWELIGDVSVHWGLRHRRYEINFSSCYRYFVPYVHIKKFVKDRFLEGQEILPLTCIGVSSGIGRLFFGYIADFPRVNRIYLQQVRTGTCVSPSSVVLTCSLVFADFLLQHRCADYALNDDPQLQCSSGDCFGDGFVRWLLHFPVGTDRFRHLWAECSDTGHRVFAGHLLDSVDTWAHNRCFYLW